MRDRTSVVAGGDFGGANHCAAIRGGSRAESIAKPGIVEEKSDECLYWLEILEESGLMHATEPTDLKGEAGELPPSPSPH